MTVTEHLAAQKDRINGYLDGYLLTGAVTNALNMPSVTAEEVAIMGPWIKLAEHLGSFAGQLTDEPIKAINILYDGEAINHFEEHDVAVPLTVLEELEEVQQVYANFDIPDEILEKIASED